MKARRIVVAGASWAEPRSALVRAIQASFPAVEVVAAGVRGATLPRWLPEAIRQAAGADVIVIEAGGNGAPTPDQIRAADQALKAAGANAVAWAMPPGWPVENSTGQRRRATGLALSAASVRTLATPALTSAEVSRDALHPTRAGYTRYGRAVAAAYAHAGPASLAIAGAVLALALAFLVTR